MKKLKKLLSIVLAVAMVMSLAVSVTASDYTIIINKTEGGITYSAYKIFDATYNTSTESYAYSIDTSDTDASVIKTWLEENYSSYFTFTLQSGSTTVYNVEPSLSFDTTAAAALAAALKTAFASGGALSTIIADQTGTVVAGGTSVSLTVADAGYYFVDTSLGSLTILDTVSTADSGIATISEKNGSPSVEKNVYEDSTSITDGSSSASDNKNSDAAIGDTVYFKTVVSSVADVSNLVIHDYMDAGLTWDDTSVVVYLLPSADTSLSDTYKLASNTDYTVSEPTGVDSGSTPTGWTSSACTFEVKITKDLTGINKNSVIVVVYSATVNENAVQYVSSGHSNDNETYVSYGTSSYAELASTQTFTYHVAIHKYDGSSNNLEGVKFKIYYYNGSGDKTYVKVSGSDGVYKVDTSETTTEMTTTSDGQILINGLDAEVEYYLEETETIAGYNMLTSDIKFMIAGANNASGWTQGDVYIYSDSSWTQTGTGTATIQTVDYNSIEVLNNKGEELPATGGIGVTIFYVVGGILVLAAAGVIVISKKRRTEK